MALPSRDDRRAPHRVEARHRRDGGRFVPAPSDRNGTVSRTVAREDEPVSFDILDPEGWPRPKGYSNGIAASGRFVFVAGQIGWNPTTSVFESDDLVDQV